MKKYRPLIFIVSMFLIGILVGFLSYHGYLLKFYDSITSFFWYYIVLTVFISIFLNVLIHELGHLITLRLNGISIKAIYVLFLTIVKNKKWEVRIYPKFMILMGGLVIPNLPQIVSEKDYETVKKALAKGIKAGPVTTKGFRVFSVLMFIFSMLFSNYIFIAIMFYFMIITLILSYLINKASKLSYESLNGDYVAYDKLNNDRRFALTYILSGTETSDYEKVSKKFLWDKVCNELRLSSEIYTASGQAFINFYLEEVIFEKALSDEQIDERIKRVYQSLNMHKEEHYVLANLLMYFYYIKDFSNEYFEIEKKLNQFNSDKLERKVIDFWTDRSNYLLGLTNDDSYKNRIYDAYKLNWLFKPLKLDKISEKPLKKEQTSDDK